MVNVFITVDTEHSIGGAFRDPRLKPVGNEKRIFGKIGNKYYGIPLIMDIADEYGIPLTFFVEVMNKYYFGPDETRKVVEYILKRGHDVQLHVHPNYLNFTLADPAEVKFSDLIGKYDLERQTEIIGEARDALIDYGASNVKAFRAGCFGANEDTLKALKANGFTIDSSYNVSFLEGPCLFKIGDINQPTAINGILELPITNFVEKSYMRTARLMPFDINGVSFEEKKFVLGKAERSSINTVVVLMHSFSFIKPYNIQYTRVRVRKNVIKRFENLCRYLAQYPDRFCVRTLGSLDAKEIKTMAQNSAHHFPKVPYILSLKRGLFQLIDRIV